MKDMRCTDPAECRADPTTIYFHCGCRWFFHRAHDWVGKFTDAYYHCPGGREIT